MSKELLKSILWIQVLNFIIKPIWIFGIDRVAQNQMGDALYGQYAVILSTSIVFSVLLDFGINNFLASQIAANKQLNIKQFLHWRLVLAAVFFVVLLTIGLVNNWNYKILGLFLINLILASIVLFYRSILQGTQAFKKDAIASVLDKIVAIILGLFVLFFVGFSNTNGLIYFLLIQALGYTCTLIYVLWQTRNMHSLSNTESVAIVWNKVKWYAALVLIMSIFTRIDSFMLTKISEGKFTDAGVYAKSFRLLDAILIVASLLSTQLLPIFSYRNKSKIETSNLVWFAVKFILTMGIPLLLFGYAFGFKIMELLYHKVGNTKEIACLIWVLASFLPMAGVYVFGTYLTAIGKLKQMCGYGIWAICINIILNAWLIPINGPLGAAQACLVTQSIFVSFCIWGAKKSNGFNWIDINGYKLLLYVFLVILLFVTVPQPDSSLLFGLFLAVVCGLLGILMLFPSIKNLVSLRKIK